MRLHLPCLFQPLNWPHINSPIIFQTTRARAMVHRTMAAARYQNLGFKITSTRLGGLRMLPPIRMVDMSSVKNFQPIMFSLLTPIPENIEKSQRLMMAELFTPCRSIALTNHPTCQGPLVFAGPSLWHPSSLKSSEWPSTTCTLIGPFQETTVVRVDCFLERESILELFMKMVR